MLDHTLRRHHGPRSRCSTVRGAATNSHSSTNCSGTRAAGRIELHQTVTRDESSAWSGRRGRIGRSHFEAVLHDPAETLCFVCGPEPLVNESVSTLKALGVPDEQIRTEQWGKIATADLGNDLQRVLHLGDAVDAARERNRLIAFSLALDAARQRDDALECIDVDPQAADRRIVQHRGLHPRRDRGVVDRLADRLAARRRRASATTSTTTGNFQQLSLRM